MTYQDYLDNWEVNYGDALEGEYGYWRNGKHYPFRVHRLSEQEFDEHRIALAKASAKFSVAYTQHSDTLMRLALEESFPHELALLI